MEQISFSKKTKLFFVKLCKCFKLFEKYHAVDFNKIGGIEI